MEDGYKQVVIVRQDLKMEKGKLAAQCSHGAVECSLSSDKKKIDLWRESHMKKIVLKVPNLQALLLYKKKAEKAGLQTALIKDAGRTFFSKPTITCLAIGPDKESKIDEVTGDLQML
ncbi:aminoacyl-tRNA hydrolase [Candidatus Woesearchaeota archaeon CG10_big_fil_rev_8_21_14_0_10_34_8]|nr:MAG: aminoacyl-tRNA hydrolase [Candidatus Woesearchaeota archaeon CG10_big_fil_rev_8_21_14_0_10_34_8]